MAEQMKRNYNPVDEATIRYRQELYSEEPNLDPARVFELLSDIQYTYALTSEEINIPELYHGLETLAGEAVKLAEMTQSEEAVEALKRIQSLYALASDTPQERKTQLPPAKDMSGAKGGNTQEVAEPKKKKGRPSKKSSQLGALDTDDTTTL